LESAADTCIEAESASTVKSPPGETVKVRSTAFSAAVAVLAANRTRAKAR
jgi:hypothetical protein